MAESTEVSPGTNFVQMMQGKPLEGKAREAAIKHNAGLKERQAADKKLSRETFPLLQRLSKQAKAHLENVVDGLKGSAEYQAATPKDQRQMRIDTLNGEGEMIYNSQRDEDNILENNFNAGRFNSLTPDEQQEARDGVGEKYQKDAAEYSGAEFFAPMINQVNKIHRRKKAEESERKAAAKAEQDVKDADLKQLVMRIEGMPGSGAEPGETHKSPIYTGLKPNDSWMGYKV